MSTRLVSCRGGKIDLAFPIQGPRVTIGRKADNMVQLPHANVSKHHGGAYLDSTTHLAYWGHA
jgi:pSer/pThr/pTyr-binding forkhead associated (FHA) protein